MRRGMGPTARHAGRTALARLTIQGVDAPAPDADRTLPSSTRLVALTDAVLERLAPPRLVWIVAWSLVAPLRPTVLFVILGFDAATPRHATLGDLFLTQAVFGYVVAVTLLGTTALVGAVRDLGPDLERLTVPDPATMFRGITSRAGPIALTLVVVAIASPSTYTAYGLGVAVVDLPLLALMTLPIMTFVWTYLTILPGLNRLGASTLSLTAFPADRSLGVGHVGAVGFTGLWLVFAAAMPALLVSGRDVTTFVLVAVVVVISVGLFVLSVTRLHRQMAAAKASYVALTRRLVEEAYGPITADTSLAALQDRAGALEIAQPLADRADRILAWPIDERAVAFITVVVTGVLTSVIVRLVFAAAGL
jgi:hypothetical protein